MLKLVCECIYILCLSADSYGTASSLSQQQPRQGVQVSHVRVVAENAVDPLLLVGEDVVQLSLQLRCLPRWSLGWWRGGRGGWVARRVPFRGARVGPVRRGVGHQGRRRPGHGGGGPRGWVERLHVDWQLLLRGWPEVWGSQRGRSDYSSPDRAEDGGRVCEKIGNTTTAPHLEVMTGSITSHGHKTDHRIVLCTHTCCLCGGRCQGEVRLSPEDRQGS